MSALSVLERWLTAINNGDIGGLKGLYAAGASLLPTFAPDLRCNEAGRAAYFDPLASRQVQVQLIADSIHQHPSGPLTVICGRYTWGDGTALPPTLARFSMVIDVHAAAPIIHHHSSLEMS